MVDFQKYLDESSQMRQDIGTQIANAPAQAQTVREDVYGGEGALNSLREQQDDKIKALYDLDKRGADRYANPESDMFIKDPFARKKLMSGQHQQELGELQGINRMIQQREDVLGSAVERGLQLFQAGLEAKKFEYNSLMDELSAALNIAKFQDSLKPKATSGTDWSKVFGSIGLGGTKEGWSGGTGDAPNYSPAGGAGSTEGDWTFQESQPNEYQGILDAVAGTEYEDDVGEYVVNQWLKNQLEPNEDKKTKAEHIEDIKYDLQNDPSIIDKTADEVYEDLIDQYYGILTNNDIKVLVERYKGSLSRKYQ